MMVPRPALRLGELHVTDNTLRVTLRSSGAALARPDAVAEGPSGLYFNKPDVKMIDNGFGAEFKIPIERDANGPDPATSELTITLFDGVSAPGATCRPSEVHRRRRRKRP